ncbi:MAG TPA: LON peptidase substrate-binding domain-containing protein [Candidatus Eisenbacteria bacterium]|jgi:Lon protease-like protein
MQAEPRQPVPVLPLANVVLFPHAMLPLRVTDLRHRTLVRDALAGERLIALALSRPGPEEVEGSAEVFPLGCLARVQDVEWLPDDCYDVKLAGLVRVRLERQVREYPYRAAHVRLVPQEPYTEDDPLVLSEREAATRVLERVLGAAASAAGLPAPPLPGPESSYEAVVNLMCMCLDAGPEEKLALLELDSVIERGRRARERVERGLRPRGPAHPGDGESN